jgi:RNA polymerase sigma factor (sigma-70 family)
MFLKLFARQKDPTDLELVHQFRQTGDAACVGELFERHTEMVYLVCLKYLKDQEESKDATMQIFETLFTALQKHEVSIFKNWLHTLAKNHCLMLLRADKKKKFSSFDDQTSATLEKSGAHAYADQPEPDMDVQVLAQGLQALNEEQRACVELFYLQKKSYKEIADLTGYEVAKVKSHIQNGKRNLRIYLEKNYEQ